MGFIKPGHLSSVTSQLTIDWATELTLLGQSEVASLIPLKITFQEASKATLPLHRSIQGDNSTLLLETPVGVGHRGDVLHL